MEIPKDESVTIELPSAAGLIPTQRELNSMMRIANSIAATKVFGMSAELAFCKILAGRELGLPPMAAVHEIECYDGKLALGAKGKVAVVRSRGLGSIDVVESTVQHAAVEFRRADWPENAPVRRLVFTIEEAAAAGLTKKDNWRKYARSMLAHRATDVVCNLHFQDVFSGVPYSPDQLGADTDEDGHVVEAVTPGWIKAAPPVVAPPPPVVAPPPEAVAAPLPPLPDAAPLPPQAGPPAYVPRWRAVDVMDIVKLTAVPPSKIADAVARAGCKHLSDLPPERIDEIAEKLLALVTDAAAVQRFKNESAARVTRASAPW